MHLTQNPFNGILSGTQKIEGRINDEKRQLIKVGDEIEFILRENPVQKFKAKVTELIPCKNFEELYMSRPFGEFGGRDLDHLLTSIYKYYSFEEEAKYGVVGIRLEVLN